MILASQSHFALCLRAVHVGHCIHLDVGEGESCFYSSKLPLTALCVCLCVQEVVLWMAGVYARWLGFLGWRAVCVQVLLSAAYGHNVGSHRRVALSAGLPLESAYAPSLTMPISPVGLSYCKYHDEAEPAETASGQTRAHFWQFRDVQASMKASVWDETWWSLGEEMND